MVNLNTSWSIVYFDFCIKILQQQPLEYRIVYGCPYYKGSAIFSLVFLSTTSEKSFIPCKPPAAVQALKVCPVRPRVLSSWRITLLEKLRAADES